MPGSLSKKIHWPGLLFAEALVLVFSLGAMGRSRHDRLSGDEGNTVARLFLDEPTWLESLALYFVLFHVLFAVVFAAAWVVGKRRRRADRVDAPTST